jgi:hypothetical protein
MALSLAGTEIRPVLVPFASMFFPEKNAAGWQDLFPEDN